MKANARILVVRRDNIGDLVCTTPLIAALRRALPDAFIAALVNSYNRDVLERNPDLDRVYAYGKAKHRSGRESLLGTYLRRAGLVLELRRERFDYAILAAPGFHPRSLRFARLAGARHVVGFTEGRSLAERRVDRAVPYGAPAARHEVEDVLRLLAPLGIAASEPRLRVVPDPELAATMRANVAAHFGSDVPGSGPLVALHISARKPSQRWPAERFAALARALHERHGARVVLLWAPGSERNPTHPGDDEKARALAAMLEGLPALPVPTFRLAELIAALDACDALVCSDGGAMHLAAALGKPIVCFFGDSQPSRWRPWGVRHELLQPESRDAADIGVEQALAAFERLRAPAR